MPGIAGNLTALGRLPACILLLATVLAGCAGPPPAPSTSPVPSLHAGLVVAVRQVSLSGSGGARAGVDAVLAGLGQGASTGNVSGQEVVVLLADQSPATMVPGQEPGQPPFQPGDHVAIVQSASATLVHQN